MMAAARDAGAPPVERASDGGVPEYDAGPDWTIRIHCRSEAEAQEVLRAVTERFVGGEQA